MQFFEQLTRKQKLMLLGAVGFLLIALLIFIIIAAANKANHSPEVEADLVPPIFTPAEDEPTPSPVVIVEPPAATPATTPPKSELEQSVPEPESTLEPTPEPIKSPEVNTNLPSGTSNQPTQTAAPSPRLSARITNEKSVIATNDIEFMAADRFAFALPKHAYTDTVIHVAVQEYADAASWRVTKDGAMLPLDAAFSGTLAAKGGFLTFRSEGKYELFGRSANGKDYKASITVLHYQQRHSA